jgi:DNA-binding FadR family transcriptional regulator
MIPNKSIKQPSPIAAPAPEPIRRRKLGDEVLERLLQRIRSGEWVAGTLLPSERDLMSSYAVGRPAIREALQTLERMGLIAIAHGERARVLVLTADGILRQVGEAARHILETSPGTLEHLKQARLMFEVSIVRIAAGCASDKHIEDLRLALEAHREAVRDQHKFLERDLEFHRTIASMTSNPIFVAVSQSMFEWMERFHVDQVRAPGAERLTIAEHTRIFKAIAARDPEAAALAMTRHLTRANKLYSVLTRN